MKSKATLALVLLVTALAFSACGDDGKDEPAGEEPTATTSGPGGVAPEPSGNAPAPSGEAQRSVKVTIAGYAYDPDPVTIQAGGKVIWQNEDSVPHTATANDESFDTGSIEEGKLKSETFKQPGTFAYVCTIHPGMNGVVEVVEKE